MPDVAVFLVGEGSHDIGGLANSPPFRNAERGFLQPIIRRILDRPVSFDGQKVTLLGKKRVSGLADALARKAHTATVLADYAGADLLVFVTDLDGGERTRTKRQRIKEIERKSAAIRAGNEKLKGLGIRCVPGIPCRTIESWAMGDPDAVESLGGDLGAFPAGKGPEDLWGKPRDPYSNHPKMVLARVMGRSMTRADFGEIAEVADFDKLSERCALSFSPFRHALEAA